jgi:hypothetical protein
MQQLKEQFQIYFDIEESHLYILVALFNKVELAKRYILFIKDISVKDLHL